MTPNPNLKTAQKIIGDTVNELYQDSGLSPQAIATLLISIGCEVMLNKCNITELQCILAALSAEMGKRSLAGIDQKYIIKKRLDKD